jgi:hypothetical protein
MAGSFTTTSQISKMEAGDEIAETIDSTLEILLSNPRGASYLMA